MGAIGIELVVDATVLVVLFAVTSMGFACKYSMREASVSSSLSKGASWKLAGKFSLLLFMFMLAFWGCGSSNSFTSVTLIVGKSSCFPTACPQLSFFLEQATH